MGLERFFNDDETAQLTRTCAAAAFLYPVERALNSVNAVGAIQSHPDSHVDRRYDPRQDDALLQKRLIPWLVPHTISFALHLSLSVLRFVIVSALASQVSAQRHHCWWLHRGA